jgi:hypothetical protein
MKVGGLILAMVLSLAAGSNAQPPTAGMLDASGAFNLLDAPWRWHLTVPRRLEEMQACGLRDAPWRQALEAHYRREMLAMILASDHSEESKGVLAIYYLGAYNASAAFPRILAIPQLLCRELSRGETLRDFDAAYRMIFPGQQGPRRRT